MTTIKDIQLKEYILEEQLGRGNLTITYRAYRKSDEAVVAIKLVDPKLSVDQQFIQRFKNATIQASKLEHPNIVRAYEAKQEGEILYMVRELIEGYPLSQIIEKEGTLSHQRMLTIARQIATALDYAHQKSIMHGDLSTSRIYISPNDYTTVADFGQMQSIAGTSLIDEGLLTGRPETMASERAKGQVPTRQADLYSLGIVCYQMLAGQPPFSGTAEAVLKAQINDQPSPLYLVNPNISISLSETVGRMLSKAPELRYNTGSEFIRALSVASQGTAPTRTLSMSATRRVVNKSVLQKYPWLWIFIIIPAVGILLALGFGIVFTWNMIQPTPINKLQSTAIGQENKTPTAVTAVIIEEPTTAPTTYTPTLAPLPTPGTPTIAKNSPFTNLLLAHNINNETNQPEQIGISFAPGSRSIYLFFDYKAIKPGTAWSHRWVWGDTELGTYTELWSENNNDNGTAWVFYLPSGGYERGPYQVTLEVEGRTVATATFVIEIGGL